MIKRKKLCTCCGKEPKNYYSVTFHFETEAVTDPETGSKEYTEHDRKIIWCEDCLKTAEDLLTFFYVVTKLSVR